MERDSSDMSSVSDDNKYPAVNLDLNIKTLNPEQDLQIFIQEMNFKQSSIDIKYPKHLFKILKRIEKISNWMLLYNIDSETMIEILSRSKISLYKQNEIIFYQNSPPLNLYIILTGEISFKKYSSLDLLTMIGSESNIIISKRYSDMKYRNSKMSRQTLQSMRNSAFKNYQEVQNKENLLSGDIIGEENLVTKTSYEYCAVVEKNCSVVKINVNVFNLFLKKNIMKTTENIRELIKTRFTYFKTLDNNMLKLYMGNITKSYPKSGEIICKEKTPSDKLYLIYQGKFAVQKNSKNLGNLLFLNKGDIFGYESLINIKPEFETESKINIKLNIEKCEYDIINKDNTSILLRLDLPFFDELTTWKICKNLLGYFKEQNKILHNFENIKNISSLIFEEKYNNLSKNKKNKSLNENNHVHLNNIKDKKYKLMFKRSVDYKVNDSNSKKYNKRKVNFLNNYVKVFPKDYIKTNFQKYKLKQSYSNPKKKKKNYISLLFKNLEMKNSIKSSKKNEDIEEYITTQEKISEIYDNNNENISETNLNLNTISKKNILEQKALSQLLSNSKISKNNINSNNSNSTRETTKRPPSVSNKKISAFDNISLTTNYKSRNKTNSTLFQNFISWNKKIAKTKTMKKKKKNRICFRNGSNVSKFDFSKELNKNNPLCFFSSFNSQKYNLTERNKKSIEKKSDNELFFVSKYNFPFIYEEDENEVVF